MQPFLFRGFLLHGPQLGVGSGRWGVGSWRLEIGSGLLRALGMHTAEFLRHPPFFASRKASWIRRVTGPGASR